MKGLKNVMQESLMDDEDIIMASAKQAADETIFAELVNNYPIDEPGKDSYGRQLNVGDWVVCVPPGSKANASMTFGVVVKITSKRITVSITNDLNKRTYAAKWYSAEEPGMRSVSLPCNMVFKIMDKQEFVRTVFA